MSNLAERLRASVLAGIDPALTDAQLLESFVHRRDEASIAALVRRHGSMVWGVCCRILRNHQDVEDAFQATFLVLVRRAASIVPREMVGNWLYGVAHRTALKARTTFAKRRARECSLSETHEPQYVAASNSWNDLAPLLDGELSRLADKYRIAIVLCDIENKARKDAALELNIPEGTLSSRLTTARQMLAKRLARRGISLSITALVSLLAENALATAPFELIIATIQATTLPITEKETLQGVISDDVASLAAGVNNAMFLNKARTLLAVTIAMALSGFVCVVLAGGQPGDDNRDAKSTTAEPAGKDNKPARNDVPPAEAAKDLIRVGDRLRIQADNTLPTAPVAGVFRVEPAGTVSLGTAYGRVRIAGQTLEEAERTVSDHLRKVLRYPRVSITRFDPLFDEQVRELQMRVTCLEKEVHDLKITIEELRKPKGK
jgi:RNA polymerase sigma factor (sigma-70 family)